MPMPFTVASIRPALPLVIGLLVGGFGVTLFRGSMPPPGGSPQERADRLEDQLKDARKQIALLENGSRRRGGGPLTDGLRTLTEDLGTGKPVSPEAVLRRFQPLLRELGPLLAKLRMRETEGLIGGILADYTNKYGLDQNQQAQLQAWLKQRMEEDAKAWSRLAGSESVSLEELEKETRKTKPDRGLDAFMAGLLDPEKAADYQTDRLKQRSWQVKSEANGKTEQLNRAVQLDDTQRQQVFGIMARGSENYDPSLDLPGANAGNGTGMEAALRVLRPEQRAAYDADRERRREDAERNLGTLGLALPDDWERIGH
jgi:hypothetical protein